MARPRKKAKRARKRERDYKAEYKRRIARAAAIGYSRSVARGHPRRAKGEVGRAELQQLRAAARILSPGQQREAGIKRARSRPERASARDRVAEIAGVKLSVPTSSRGTRRSVDAEKFAAAFVQLGIGTMHDAYTLYFSP